MKDMEGKESKGATRRGSSISLNRMCRLKLIKKVLINDNRFVSTFKKQNNCHLSTKCCQTKG